MSNVLGFEKLVRKFNKLGGDVGKVAKQSMGKNIKLVKAEAKLLCPVDTGDLRKSISSKTLIKRGNIQGIIFTNLEYAPYVEFGTGQIGEATNRNSEVRVSYKQDWIGQPAVPFMYPAVKNNKERVLENIKEDFSKAIREIAAR